MYTALIDPPNDFVPKDALQLVIINALQLTQGAALTLTFKPPALVIPHKLRVLLLAPLLELQAYPPI